MFIYIFIIYVIDNKQSFFFIGVFYNIECMDIFLFLVVMVLFGGMGIFKCLFFLLQLLIVVMVWRKQKYKGVEFMSEMSGLDNIMNWIYIVVFLVGVFFYNYFFLFVLFLGSIIKYI